MERREFCKLLGCAALLTCAGGASGCSRLLQWSAAQRGAGAAGVTMRGEQTTSAASSLVTPSTESSTSAESTGSGPAGAAPDLAVYQGSNPKANVRAAVAALGGMSRFVRPGAHVLVKPNVIVGRDPSLAATTNPDVVAAVVELALEAGAADVVVLDNPTGPARPAFEGSGILAAVDKAGGRVKLLTDRNFETVRIPKGRVLTRWPIVRDVFQADTVIGVPIAKTHGMAGLTMAMKNIMGVMGGERGLIHQDFEQKIVDVGTLVRPHLTILDAYRILIANGPTGGTLSDVRTPKTVIAGTDPVAVDSYGATLFGMTAANLGYLVRAAEQGLGVTDLSRLRIKKGRT